jgi:hypothetical protein
MAKLVPPTKKNSPAIHEGENSDNLSAEHYAPPHTMSGKKLTQKDIGFAVKMPARNNWTPLNGGVSIGHMDSVKEEGITMRGHGAATKGIKSRGPMA